MSDVNPRVERSMASVREAANDLLCEYGVSAITVDAIAKRSGVSKATIYRHWDSRTELVNEVLEAALTIPSQIDTGDIEADLRSALERLEGVLTSKKAEILVSMLGAAEHDDEIRIVRDNVLKARSAVAIGRLETAQERGEIRGDISAEDLHVMLAGPLFYRRMREGGDTSESQVDRILAVMMPFLLDK